MSDIFRTKRMMRIALCINIILLLSSCSKSGIIDADDIFIINNTNIAVTDDAGGRQALDNSLILKTDVFSSDLVNPGGYAYPSVIKFPDGSFLMAAVGHPMQWGDFSLASISSKISRDSGRTWAEERTMQENIGKINTSAPCLVNLAGNVMLSLFLIKNSYTDIQIACKESADYGDTWSGLVPVTDSSKGYNITMNARLCKMRTGRLILPMAYLHNIDSDQNNQIIFCYISDDNGKTWRKTRSYGAYTALTEPGITEMEDGSLLMVLRNNTGYVMFSTSKDGGETWGEISKTKIQTPSAPQAIVYSQKYHTLFMVWNNIALDPSNFINRYVLSLAVSKDGGITWIRKGDLENNSDYLYFYPAVTAEDDELIVTYCWYKKTYSRPAVTFERFDIEKLIK